MKKNPKKPARLWAVWSPTFGYYEANVLRRLSVSGATHLRTYSKGMLHSPDWRVVPVRLVKITPRRGRRSK